MSRRKAKQEAHDKAYDNMCNELQDSFAKRKRIADELTNIIREYADANDLTLWDIGVAFADVSIQLKERG